MAVDKSRQDRRLTEIPLIGIRKFSDQLFARSYRDDHVAVDRNRTEADRFGRDRQNVIG